MLTSDDDVLQAVRRRHELRVLDALAIHGTRTRRQLETDTNLSRTTLSAIVGDLRQNGVLAEHDQLIHAPGRSGRPTKVLSLNPKTCAAVGIELGRRRISITVTGFDGSRVTHESAQIPGTLALQEKVQHAATMLRELISSGAITAETVIGIGVGIASRHANPHSLSDGVQQQSDPEGASLQPLRDELAVPLLWDNNIRLAAMSYVKSNDNLLYAALSAGVSCAVVSNGRLLRGANGTAGELGHMSVDFAGPMCWCGRRGCLESYINESNILLESARRGQTFDSIAAMAKAAADGNSIARSVVDWAAELLARAISGACVLLDPSRVVIAGELSQFGEQLLVPIRNALAEQSLDIGPRSTDISTAVFAVAAGSDGAAQMVLKHWATSNQS